MQTDCLPTKQPQSRSGIVQGATTNANRGGKVSSYGCTMRAPAKGKRDIRYSKKYGCYVPRPNLQRMKKTIEDDFRRKNVHLLVQRAEHIMLEYLCAFNSTTYEEVKHFRENSHEHMRIFESCFTGMSLVGDFTNKYNQPHVDRNDACSIIVFVGDEIGGGNTNFYSRNAIDEDPTYVHPFQHGSCITGPFDNVTHEGATWTGDRGVIVFYVNKSILNHFLRYNNAPYEEFLGRLTKKSNKRRS